MIVNVTSGAHLATAVKNAADRHITIIRVDADEILIDKPIIIPKSLFRKNDHRRLEIDLQGNTIKATAAMPYMIGREEPVDAAEANNIMLSQGFTIKNGFLNGGNLAETGILLRCNYHSRIDTVTVASTTKDDIMVPFGMNTLILQCEIRNVPGIGIGVTNGTFPGAGFNKSGSNMTRVMMCRVFPREGQEACFADFCSGNVYFDGCTVDAHTGHKPKRGWWVKHTGSTTCKLSKIDTGWAETLTHIAMIDAELAGGYLKISNVFPQYGGTLVRAQGDNYSKVVIEMPGHLTGDVRFEAVDTDTVWIFRDCPDNIAIETPAYWINGKLPGKWFAEGSLYSQEYGFKSVGAMKLNGSKLITETTMNAAIAAAIAAAKL